MEFGKMHLDFVNSCRKVMAKEDLSKYNAAIDQAKRRALLGQRMSEMKSNSEMKLVGDQSKQEDTCGDPVGLDVSSTNPARQLSMSAPTSPTTVTPSATPSASPPKQSADFIQKLSKQLNEHKQNINTTSTRSDPLFLG